MVIHVYQSNWQTMEDNLPHGFKDTHLFYQNADLHLYITAIKIL